MNLKTISILGATGSIGCSTIAIIREINKKPNSDVKYELKAITANNNVDDLIKIAIEFKPEFVAIADEEKYSELKSALSPHGIKCGAGKGALLEAASIQSDMVMAAIVGFAGLMPTIKAVERGATILLANKECLVSAGDYFMQKAAQNAATILPVDSEHNAIFQVLNKKNVFYCNMQTNMKFLENDKIVLRAVEPEDLELLYRWENDSSIWIAGNTRAPYSRYQLKNYISHSPTDIYESKQIRLMIVSKIENKTVGTVDLFDFDIHNSRIALGLYVAEEYSGRGMATESLKTVEEYVFNFLKINQLYVQIIESNLVSRKLFENDYELHGKLKNWIKTPANYEDVLTYQKFRKI